MKMFIITLIKALFLMGIMIFCIAWGACQHHTPIQDAAWISLFIATYAKFYRFSKSL